MANQVDDIVSFQLEIADAQAQHDKLQKSIQRHRAALGVDVSAQLSRLRGNRYLQMRMNALALKTRIRDRLRSRKFELERIERAFRQSAGGMQFFNVYSEY